MAYDVAAAVDERETEAADKPAAAEHAERRNVRLEPWVNG
jgi:hypothetical protein